MNSLRVTLVSGLGVYTAGSSKEFAEYAPPLGVLTLAALLRHAFTVSLVDLDHLWRKATYLRPEFQAMAVEEIIRTQAEVLGFSAISGSYPLTIRLAEECSRRLPGATIVLGGPQASVTDLETMAAFPFIDLVLRGEADDTFPALLTCLATGSSITHVPGLTFRERGRIRRNANASAILDMDRLPLPAYDMVPRAHELQVLPLEIGRGCPYACTFCSTNDFFRRRFRLKSPEKALEEMNTLHETWGVTTFDLIHDMFTVDRKRVAEFCQTLIDAGKPYKWSCSARTDSVDRELLHLMKRAGCHDLFFGIETGSQRMQRVIDKDLDIGYARKMLLESSGLEIRTTASLIVGYPQESMEDLRATVDFYSAAMVMPWVDPQFNVLSPLAATPITTEYRDQLTLDENWTTVSENGSLQDAVDRLMIAVHPDIFPNFYGFPYFTGRDLIQRIRDFLFFGNARCGGLMRALYVHTKDMLGVFERWEKTSLETSVEWFASLEFVHHLISFCEAAYPDVPSIRATAAFCRGAYFKVAGTAPRSMEAEPYLDLSERCVLVDCNCDIHAVLGALALGAQPPASAFCSPVTAVVKSTALNRASILHFPSIPLDLLRHAEKNSTLAAIERDFEDRQISISGLPPWKVVAGGIDYLEKLDLVRRVFPPAADLPQSAGPEHGWLTATG